MIKTIKAVDYLSLSQDAQDYIKENWGGKSNNSYIHFYHLDNFKSKEDYKGGELFAEYEDCVIERGDDILTDSLWDMGAKEPEEIYILISW